MGGIYNPFDKKLMINKEALKYVNMDRFKLIIAHELVHVEQFKNDDGLLKEYDGMIRNLVNKIRNIAETGNINSDMINKLIDEINNGIMHDLESQAAHIESNLYIDIYTTATVFDHKSFADTLIQSFMFAILPKEYKKMLQSIVEGKMKQYK